MLRRSVATAIDQKASIDLAAELLGHTDPRITLQHYIRRNEMVNPITAELLDAALPAREHKVEVDGQVINLVDAAHISEAFRTRALAEGEETTEIVVPVKWEMSVPLGSAIKESGLFASQVTVCKLRDERTIKVVEERFGLATMQPAEPS